jgi:hypothetical protein
MELDLFWGMVLCLFLLKQQVVSWIHNDDLNDQTTMQFVVTLVVSITLLINVSWLEPNQFIRLMCLTIAIVSLDLLLILNGKKIYRLVKWYSHLFDDKLATHKEALRLYRFIIFVTYLVILIIAWFVFI